MTWGQKFHTLSKIDVPKATPSGAALRAAVFYLHAKKRDRVVTYAPPPTGAKVKTRAPLGSAEQRARLGGGAFWPPPLRSREPRNIATSGKRRWIAPTGNYLVTQFY